MNLWFAANIAENSQGGVARNMLGFSRELRELGHNVQLVFAREPALFRNYLVFMVYLALKLLATSRRKRPSVIFARSTDGLCCALLVRLSGMKTRVILHNHGWEERVHAISIEHRTGKEPSLFTWKSPMIRFPLLRLTLRLCHGCLCGTLDEIRWLRRRFPRVARKFRYVPNGVDPIPETGGHDFNAPLFLCVGAAGWRKNIGHTLSVFALINQRIPRSRLLLVGVGTAGIDAFAPPGLNRSAVETIASASMTRMMDYFRRCPFLLTTSWYEGGHALAVLEAMAGGCIVFARAIPSVAEIIHDGANGMLLACDDPGSDAAIITTVLGDLGTLERISANARHSARRNRWPRQGSRMNRLLQQLTNGKGG